MNIPEINTQMSLYKNLYVDDFTTTTVKPVLSSHLKIDKTKVLMENGSLMEVESIALNDNWY